MVNTNPKDIMSTEHRKYQREFLPSNITSCIFSRIPILNWLPHYTFHNLQCDFIAGITVGMMVIPQAFAYASIARLSNEYGLYSSFMGCIVYCILGTSKDVTLGPTAILSIMVSTYNVPGCGELAVALSLCVGIILLFMGIFNLGFLVRFVSVPVISSFTTAAAITIALGQLKDLNGLKNVPRDVFPSLKFTLGHISQWNYYDLAFGIGCIILLLLMRLLPRLHRPDETNICLKILRKVAWFCGIGRNALVVLISCCIIYGFDKANVSHRFTLIKDINCGIPEFKVSLYKFYNFFV